MIQYQVSAQNEYTSYHFLYRKNLAPVKSVGAVCCLPWSQAIIFHFRIFEISFPLPLMVIQIMLTWVCEMVYDVAIGDSAASQLQ